MEGKRYRVYLITDRDYGGNGVDEHSRQLLGVTFAKSKAKAISNIAYREGVPRHAYYEMWGDGLCTKYLDAEEVTE